MRMNSPDVDNPLACNGVRRTVHSDASTIENPYPVKSIWELLLKSLIEFGSWPLSYSAKLRLIVQYKSGCPCSLNKFVFRLNYLLSNFVNVYSKLSSVKLFFSNSCPLIRLTQLYLFSEATNSLVCLENRISFS